MITTDPAANVAATAASAAVIPVAAVSVAEVRVGGQLETCLVGYP
jgi:hypothetical protein